MAPVAAVMKLTAQRIKEFGTAGAVNNIQPIAFANMTQRYRDGSLKVAA